MQIRVWSFDNLRPSWREDLACLSEREVARANRFRFEKHKIDYVISAAQLRRTLAHELNCEASAVQFTYGQYGKPELTEPLHFNMSHCKSHLTIALSRCGPLGIDVESLDRTIEPTQLAKTCFSLAEQDQLATFALQEQSHLAFFRGWTRKEAFIKALGYGLHAPLKEFDVDLSATDVNTLIESRIENTEGADWQIFNLDIDPRISAAITVSTAQQVSSARDFIIRTE